MKIKSIVMLSLAVVATSLTAMPTKQELKQVEGLVQELMRPDLDAFKARSYPANGGDEQQKKFRRHAAAIYAEAIVSGDAGGLVKVKAQRRIDEVKGYGEDPLLGVVVTHVAKIGKVQLWEGGPYWAEMNIGAKKPEDYGYYFWWGDTVGYKRENDAWVASDGSSSNFSFEKKNVPTSGKKPQLLQNEGWTTEDGALTPQHDAAHVQWGGGWRMPTIQELSDLNSKCDWTWTTQNGVKGYVVRGRGDYASNNIFLPAAGFGRGTSLNYSGSYGLFWSSVPNSDSYIYSWRLFYSSYHYTGNDGYRSGGFSVRPVQGLAK